MLSVMRVLFAEDPSNSIRGPILLSKNCWAYFYEIIATHGILAVHVVKNRFKIHKWNEARKLFTDYWVLLFFCGPAVPKNVTKN